MFPNMDVPNMDVQTSAATTVAQRRARAMLDSATRVLVADPGASLAEVAEAAGVGRTTLHKHFPTRDDLVRAVGLRAVARWEEAVTAVEDDALDGGLRDLMAAAITCGPELAFLWRNPALDSDDEITRLYCIQEKRVLAVLQRAQRLGVIGAGTPDWWLLQSFYALGYTAFEMVHSGHLAPRDAPGLALRTLLQGIGAGG